MPSKNTQADSDRNTTALALLLVGIVVLVLLWTLGPHLASTFAR